MSEERRDRWEHYTEWPLIVVALMFLAAYATPIITPSIPQAVKSGCVAVIWFSWAMYLIDYLVRLSLSRDRRTFFKTNWLDLLIVAFPLLRPLRLFELVALFRIFSRTSQRELRGRVAFYAGGLAVLGIIVSSLAVTNAERGKPGANIHGVADGFWWAVTTMATVGYGDKVPVTPTGRLIGVVLMIGGVALLGVVTATIASWLVQKIGEVTEKEEGATRTQMEALHQEIRDLQGNISRLEAALLAGTAVGERVAPGIDDGGASSAGEQGASSHSSSAS